MVKQLESKPTGKRWYDFANCEGKDQEIFFPSRNQPSTEAQRLCGQCAVQLFCLRDGINFHERYGIRAGYAMSAVERRGGAVVMRELAQKLLAESQSEFDRAS